MERKKVRVIFASNGNTAVFENDEQVAELQKSWLLIFAKFLEENNVDILNSVFELPGFPRGCVAKLNKTEEEYHWSMVKEK